MAFIERQLDAEAYQAYKRLLGAGENVRLSVPYHWMVDELTGVQIFELGGRGEMPASTGAPPDAYVLVVNSAVYQFGLRCNVTDGKSGGTIYRFLVESMYCPTGNEITNTEVISFLREALFECEVARLRRVRSRSFVEDVVFLTG